MTDRAATVSDPKQTSRLPARYGESFGPNFGVPLLVVALCLALALGWYVGDGGDVFVAAVGLTVIAGGAVVLPSTSYGAFGSFAQWLPSGALGDAMRAAFIDGSIAWASLLCLLGWAVVGGYLTSRTFKWE